MRDGRGEYANTSLAHNFTVAADVMNTPSRHFPMAGSTRMAAGSVWAEDITIEQLNDRFLRVTSAGGVDNNSFGSEIQRRPTTR